MFRGLNIEHILRSIETQNVAPAGSTHLDTMLTKCNFPKSVVDDNLTIRFEEPASMPSETKDGSQDKFKKVGSKSSQSKRFMVPSNYVLERLEIDLTRQSSEMTRELCNKLAKDAFRISNAHANIMKRELTTCICVVLRNESQLPYKFVFHNSNGSLPPSMRNEAAHLKYEIKSIEPGHAEVNMVDYLTYSARQYLSEGVDSKPKNAMYTHILGMGCSRKHCQECNALLNLFLGCGFSIFTAAMEKINCRRVIEYQRKEEQEYV
jgi:hypothetical protein